MTTEELITFGCGAIFLFQGTALVLGAAGTRSWRRAPEVVVLGLGQLSVGAGQWAELEATRAWAPWSDMVGAHLYWINVYAVPVPMLLFNHLFMGRGCGGSFAWGWKSLLAWCVLASTYEIATGAPGGVEQANNAWALGTLALISVNIATGHMRTSDTGSLLQNASAVMVLATLHDVLAASGAIAGAGVRLIQFGLLVVLLAMVYALLVRAKTNNEALATIKSELQTAQAIQRSLLPGAPTNVPPEATATRCMPTDAVGGDIYDFHEAGENRIGMLIADVTGHGVPAAMLASMVKAAASGESAHAADPGRVLAGMNRRLLRDAAGNLVSAVYTYADLETGRFAVACAGHPQPLIQRRDGSTSWVDAAGPLLGLIDDASYTTVEGRLAEGERILAYTDGVTEADNVEGEMFGNDGLRLAAQNERGTAAADTVDRIIGRVQAWCDGQKLADDLTMAIIARPRRDAGSPERGGDRATEPS